MSIVAERVARVLRAGLPEEVERQTRDDDARGPEPEAVVTRTFLPVGRGWEVPEQTVLPSMPVLPSGFVAAVPAGVEGEADEVRMRRLMIAAIGRFGSARCGQ